MPEATQAALRRDPSAWISHPVAVQPCFKPPPQAAPQARAQRGKAERSAGCVEVREAMQAALRRDPLVLQPIEVALNVLPEHIPLEVDGIPRAQLPERRHAQCVGDEGHPE